jgi:hypothetical protein
MKWIQILYQYAILDKKVAVDVTIRATTECSQYSTPVNFYLNISTSTTTSNNTIQHTIQKHTIQNTHNTKHTQYKTHTIQHTQ